MEEISNDGLVDGYYIPYLIKETLFERGADKSEFTKPRSANVE